MNDKVKCAVKGCKNMITKGADLNVGGKLYCFQEYDKLGNSHYHDARKAMYSALAEVERQSVNSKKGVALDSLGGEFPQKQFEEKRNTPFDFEIRKKLEERTGESFTTKEEFWARWGWIQRGLADAKELSNLKDRIGILEIELSEKRLASTEIKKRLKELVEKLYLGCQKNCIGKGGFDEVKDVCRSCDFRKVKKELLELSK